MTSTSTSASTQLELLLEESNEFVITTMVCSNKSKSMQQDVLLLKMVEFSSAFMLDK